MEAPSAHRLAYDVGFGIVLGSVFGILGFRRKLKGMRLKKNLLNRRHLRGFRNEFKANFRSIKSWRPLKMPLRFAVWLFLFSTFDCLMRAFRNVDDSINGIMAGTMLGLSSWTTRKWSGGGLRKKKLMTKLISGMHPRIFWRLRKRMMKAGSTTALFIFLLDFGAMISTGGIGYFTFGISPMEFEEVLDSYIGLERAPDFFEESRGYSEERLAHALSWDPDEDDSPLLPYHEDPIFPTEEQIIWDPTKINEWAWTYDLEMQYGYKENFIQRYKRMMEQYNFEESDLEHDAYGINEWDPMTYLDPWRYLDREDELIFMAEAEDEFNDIMDLDHYQMMPLWYKELRAAWTDYTFSDPTPTKSAEEQLPIDPKLVEIMESLQDDDFESMPRDRTRMDLEIIKHKIAMTKKYKELAEKVRETEQEFKELEELENMKGEEDEEDE